MKTKVIYRTFRDTGDTIAIFPEIPFDRMGDHCLSYMQVGQHGACPPMGTEFAKMTRSATPEEIEPLQRELERLEYDLEPHSRVTCSMHIARRKAAQQRTMKPE